MAAPQPTITVMPAIPHERYPTMRGAVVAEQIELAGSALGPARIKGFHRLWALVCPFLTFTGCPGRVCRPPGPGLPRPCLQAWANPYPALVTVPSLAAVFGRFVSAG